MDVSRIAGIYSAAGAENLISVLDDMLRASRSDVSWLTRSEQTGKSAVGWCGVNTPNIVLDNHMTHTMDGSI